MRRLGRWLLGGLSALSLAFCLAIAVLWSLFGDTLIQAAWLRGRTRCSLYMGDGRIGYAMIERWPYRSLSLTRVPQGVTLPCVSAIVAFAILPSLQLRRWLLTKVPKARRATLTVAAQVVSMVVGISLLVWLVARWLPGHSSDDPGMLASGAVTIILSVVPTWLGLRGIVASLSRSPQPGVCRGCGYDLRATPDRCPECGAIPTATAVNR